MDTDFRRRKSLLFVEHSFKTKITIMSKRIGGCYVPDTKYMNNFRIIIVITVVLSRVSSVRHQKESVMTNLS